MTMEQAIEQRKDSLGVHAEFGHNAKCGKVWVTDATPRDMFAHLQKLGTRPYWLSADAIGTLNAPTRY